MHPRRIQPGPAQESVWDYPRPPIARATPKHIRVIYNDLVIADTTQAIRVLETSHPPTYYIPCEDVRMDLLTMTKRRSICEWKGHARYYTITAHGRASTNAAWGYPEPVPRFAQLKDHLAFYPSKVDACFVDDERVQAQEGDFYGGWITGNVVGPFKGAPGTWSW
jgi:uncharacterized protein (DUF427 family)